MVDCRYLAINLEVKIFLKLNSSSLDENFIVKHSKPGILGYANKGPHTNNSQFYITLTAAPWLDQTFVAFGYS